MNIAIIGRTETLYDTASLLLQNGHDVRIVVTAKAAPEYSITSKDFKKLADDTGVPFLHTARIGEPDQLKILEDCGPLDIGISMNYVGVIPDRVIDGFRLGILNAHGGDLPRYRGNACQAWAIINGESRVGLCIHKMVGGELDSGDIVCREYFPLDESVRVGDVLGWIHRRTPSMFLNALALLDADRDFFLERQSTNPADALRCYPRRPEDGRIDWTRAAVQIVRLVNASSEPFAGAYCMLEDRCLRIWRAERWHDNEVFLAVPGQVLRRDTEDGTIVVAAGTSAVRVSLIEIDSKRQQPAALIRSLRTRLT